jgi:ABC-type phosphate/phosphonate transport system substrate-binding protein
MTRRNLLGLAILGVALGLVPTVSAQLAKDAPIRVGMAKSFFNDVPKVMVDIATEPFPELLNKTTGLDGILSTDDDAFEVARKLDANQLQIGVFHGHELAWAQKKYPKLTPLMIVTNSVHEVRVFIVVHNGSPAKSMADLRGKNIDMPKGSKEHTRVFVARNAADNAQADPNAFFGKITHSANSNVALDGVCFKKTDAVAVDTIALEYYKDIKGPTFAKNLRILQESAPFPQPVLAYNPGAVPAATIDQFRKGLLTAHKLPMGRGMMDMWKIESFDDVPGTYTKSLAEVLKGYPLQEATKISLR